MPDRSAHDSADVFLRLPTGEQALELERRLSEARERRERHHLVASAIRGYLDQLNGKRVDLNELARIIREAPLSGCGTG
jgi:hypothetical protein